MVLSTRSETLLEMVLPMDAFFWGVLVEWLGGKLDPGTGMRPFTSLTPLTPFTRTSPLTGAGPLSSRGVGIGVAPIGMSMYSGTCSMLAGCWSCELRRLQKSGRSGGCGGWGSVKDYASQNAANNLDQ